MATSGSFNTNKEGSFYCTVSWSRTGYDSAKNEHYIKYSVVAHNTAGKYRSVYTKELTINGSRVYYNTTSKNFYDGDTVTSGNITIKSSNAAGDGSLTMSFKAGVGTSQSTNISGSQTWSLNRIPRYATSNQTVASKTETTIRMNWSSDSTIDYIWYSTNNGSSWTGVDVADGTSGSYTITGLAANTTYNIKTRVRRKDSQLTTDSSALAVTTYAYPYANSMPNFTIGEQLTINFYNPLARNMSVEVIAQDNSIIQSFTMTGNTVSGFAGNNDKQKWYASIPNSKTGTYKVKVTYAGHVETKTGGTYQVNVNECSPNTGTLTYQDTKASTVAITDNNQLIIQNQSTLQIAITNAEAKRSATLTKASVNINGVITNKNFAAGSTSLTIDIGTINVASNITIPITVTDSRGISSTTNLVVQVLPWSLPTAIINLERVANFYTTTNILVNADFSSLDNKNTITIQYQIKKVTDTNYGALVTLQDNVQSQFQADNLYEWNVKVILTDRLGSTTYNLKLSKGIPIVFFDSRLNSTGFNCFPKEEDSVEIDGIVMNRSIITAGGNSSVTATGTGDIIIPITRAIEQIGNKFTISNNRIYVGAGVNKVLVSAMAYFNLAANRGGALNLFIRKNGANVAGLTNGGYASTSSRNANLVISPRLVSVQEGDYFEYYAYLYNGDVARSDSSTNTYLTIETVG